ncbi:transposase family protein, partial [Candidatus Parcubacteria bacterium]|nr:transposase family protein [Candidatus Parcubacteria bacterium]
MFDLWRLSVKLHLGSLISRKEAEMKSEKNADFPLSFSGVRIVKLQQTNGSLEIWVEKDTPVGICPTCGMVSDKVNDIRYHSVIDRPVFAHNMTIWVKKRRFKCFNEDCSTKTFT